MDESKKGVVVAVKLEKERREWSVKPFCFWSEEEKNRYSDRCKTGQEEEMLLKFIAGWVWICKRGVLSERAY